MREKEMLWLKMVKTPLQMANTNNPSMKVFAAVMAHVPRTPELSKYLQYALKDGMVLLH